MVDRDCDTDISRCTTRDMLIESMVGPTRKGKARIDYRHIIGSLVRKPGAFARYRFREKCTPATPSVLRTTRCAAGRESVRTWTDADTAPCRDDDKCEVERALRRLLKSSVRFDYAVVRQLAAPASPEIPSVELSGEVDLGVYDRLLTGGAR